MSALRGWLGRSILVLVLCVSGAGAWAKKGAVVVNTGDELFEVGPFPAEVVAQYPRTADVRVGYKCAHFGLFWADLWTWDCKLVAITGENRYADLPIELHDRLANDTRFALAQAQRGWWNHYAFPALLAGIAALVLWAALPRRRSAPAGAAGPAPTAA